MVKISSKLMIAYIDRPPFRAQPAYTHINLIYYLLYLIMHPSKRANNLKSIGSILRTGLIILSLPLLDGCLLLNGRVKVKTKVYTPTMPENVSCQSETYTQISVTGHLFQWSGIRDVYFVLLFYQYCTLEMRLYVVRILT